MKLLRDAFQRADGSARPAWKALSFLACNGLAVASLGWLLVGLFPGAPWALRLWITAAVTAGVSWAFLASEGLSFGSMGWEGGWRWGTEFGAGCLLGFGLMASMALILGGLGGFHWVLGSGGLAALTQGGWLFLAVAFREEILFRGYPFQRLMEAVGPWTTLVLTSAGFAFAHWDNPGMIGATRVWALANIGLAGLLLGVAYLRTRRLALPLGLHLGWNWTQGCILGFPVSGLGVDSLLVPVSHPAPPWLSGGAFGLEASLPCAVVTALAIGGLLWWKPRETR